MSDMALKPHSSHDANADVSLMATVDAYFRQFSGHTEVNATDLRSLRYPAESRLIALGKRIGSYFPEQGALDRVIDEVT